MQSIKYKLIIDMKNINDPYRMICIKYVNTKNF